MLYKFYPSGDEENYEEFTRQVPGIFKTVKLGNLNLILGHPKLFPRIKGVYIYLDHKTSLRDIISQWYVIDKKRQNYYEVYGDTMFWSFNEILLFRLKHWRERKPDQMGLGYKRLTQFINIEASIYLHQFYRSVEESDFDYEGWDSYTGSSPEKFLRVIFNTFNLDINFRTFAVGVKKIKEQSAPWNVESEPINQSLLREKLRYLDKRLEENKINLGDQNIYGMPGYNIYFPFSVLGYHTQDQKDIKAVFNLIKKSYPENWEKYNEWVWKWLSDISEEEIPE